MFPKRLLQIHRDTRYRFLSLIFLSFPDTFPVYGSVLLYHFKKAPKTAATDSNDAFQNNTGFSFASLPSRTLSFFFERLIFKICFHIILILVFYAIRNMQLPLSALLYNYNTRLNRKIFRKVSKFLFKTFQDDMSPVYSSKLFSLIPVFALDFPFAGWIIVYSN